jgi:ribosomal protein L21
VGVGNSAVLMGLTALVIFKKRKRKKYRRRGNHRQWFTEVRVAAF